MIPLVAIGLITIVIASLVLINGSIDNQQELAEINHTIQQKNQEITSELINIKGDIINGSIELTNSQNEEIHIIQIRVYDDDGNYVESFDVSEIILGNTKLEILPDSLPIILQEMLLVQ